MSTDEAVRSVIPEDVLRNLANVRHRRKAREDDGRCSCGRFRAVCSPDGSRVLRRRQRQEQQ